MLPSRSVYRSQYRDTGKRNNIGALPIGIGFWGPFYYNYTHHNSIGNLKAAHRPPRPGRLLGGRHDARSGAFAFAGCRGAATAG